MFITALFTVAKIRKQPINLSLDEWIKTWCVYTYTYTHAHNGITFSHEKEANLTICNNMGIMLSEISQKKKTDIV